MWVDNYEYLLENFAPSEKTNQTFVMSVKNHSGKHTTTSSYFFPKFDVVVWCQSIEIHHIKVSPFNWLNQFASQFQGILPLVNFLEEQRRHRDIRWQQTAWDLRSASTTGEVAPANNKQLPPHFVTITKKCLLLFMRKNSASLSIRNLLEIEMHP